MCFSAAASSVNDHGSMNLASKTAVSSLAMPSSVAPNHSSLGCRKKVWMWASRLPVSRSNQWRFQIFSYNSELNSEIPGKVFRLDLAALLPPEPNQCPLIRTHRGTRVRPAKVRLSPGNRYIQSFHNGPLESCVDCCFARAACATTDSFPLCSAERIGARGQMSQKEPALIGTTRSYDIFRII
jgi:hypothetical protein